MRSKSFEHEALAHLSELEAAALRFARNRGDAEDLVQETLLRALCAWDRFRQGTNCRAWLLRILTNSFINDYRRHRREKRFLGHGGSMVCPRRRRAAADPETVMIEQSLADEVVVALGRLPPEYRDVVVLADLRGLTYREIARLLQCPIGTVMSRLHRGRRLLEPALDEYARSRGICRQAA